jgi:phage tail-like protein
MTYKQGRPTYHSLPIRNYQDNDVADWLTHWHDQKVVNTANILSNFYKAFDPFVAPEDYLNFLAYLVGLSQEYWDVKWSNDVKRQLISVAHELWSTKGTLLAISKVLDIHQLEYAFWISSSIRLSFTLPVLVGSDDLRFYVRLPLKYSRTSSEFKEAERSLRNYSAAIVDARVMYEYFYLGFSQVGEAVFS